MTTKYVATELREKRAATFSKMQEVSETARAKGWNDELRRVFDDGEKELRELAVKIAEAEAGSGVGAAHDSGGSAPSWRRSTPTEQRSAAQEEGLRTVEANFRKGWLPDYAAERAEKLIDNGPAAVRSLAGRWASTTGAPEYRSAFAKYMADPTRGHMLWTPEESEAWRAVQALDGDLGMRAMSGTATATGAALVPMTLDPTILLTNDGNNNPLRALATVGQTMTDSWTGVTSAGASAEWKTEWAEAADGSPTLAEVEIDMFTGDSYIPYSYEVGMDSVDFLDKIVRILIDAADNLMATAYTTGNGTSAPQGIITGAAAAGTAITVVNGQGSEALAATDPFDLQNALPARFSANATWQAHIATMNAYRRFETGNGAHEFPELRQTPPYLLGKRFFENSNMDSAINAAASENNYSLLYGDIRQAFYIVDRVGTRLEAIPNLMGANQRPVGARGAFLWFRTGSKVVIPEALRLLNVATTA